MQERNPTHPEAIPGSRVVDLDPHVIAKNKALRFWRYNTLQIPALRFGGLLLLSLVVILYQRFVSADTGAGWTVQMLMGYACASWLCLYVFYGRTGPVDLGLAFLILDVPVWILAIYATGGERSWLFIILLLRVIDQTHTSFRRALFFGQFVTLSYLVLISYLQSMEHHAINWSNEFGKIFLIYASCLYASMVALAVERTQKRVKASFQMTRDLAIQLKEKSGQLEASRAEMMQAKDAAEAANIAKSQFLATVSHELRAPMNAVLGMLHLLQNTELTARQRDYASKSESSTKTLLNLINDILDFSKVEAGRMTLEQEPFYIDHVLRDLSVVLAANCGNKEIQVLFDVDPQLPAIIRGDEMRLRQVLLNLGGNAIKFTSEGEVVLSLRQHSITPTRVEIAFAVRDTGIGIAADYQRSIFSGFSQAEASTTRRYGGTGLGLAISRRIVDLMGGDIQLESVPGVGSTFSFVVPFALPASDSPTAPASVPPVTTDAAVSQPKRVLVIESSDVAAKLIQEMVQRQGWKVERANGGVQALEMIRFAATKETNEFPYPLIFTSWGMPGMDGWEISKHIRQMVDAKEYAQPIIIMVTGHGHQMLSQRSEQEQRLINGFVNKPMTASMLFDAYVEAQSGHFGVTTMTLGRSSQRRLADMRILVVEDNLINQQVADELLSAEGAIVSLAANGQQGVDAVMVAAPQFDVVLMDVQMPVLDGYGATRLIRQELRLTSLPIIAMTANAMASDREACLTAGMNEHIGKPFDMDKLVTLLIRMTGFSVAHCDEPAAPVTDFSTDALVEISGLDLSTALARMAGMRTLYGRTARDFCALLEGTKDELRELLRHQNWDALKMRLHTLKGNAGTLGATALAAKAAQMEVLCKSASGFEVLADQLDQLGPLIETTRQSLKQASALLDPDGSYAPGARLHNAQTKAPTQALGLTTPQITCLRGLGALLEASNLEALQRFADLRPQLAEQRDLCDALDAALQVLDLQQASALCIAALADAGASLGGANAA